MALAARFLAGAAPVGPLLLYGASSFTVTLLEELRSFPQTAGRIIGVVDRNAKSQPFFEGLSTLTPEEAVGQEATVIIAHPRHGGEMRAVLLDLGMPTARVLSLLHDPAYAAMALDELRRSLLGDPPPCDVLVFVDTNFSILEDEALVRALPTGSAVLGVHFAPWQPYRPEAGLYTAPSFPVLDLRGSLPLLLDLLARAQPRLIYLRSHFPIYPLARLLRIHAPRSRIVHEVYDFIAWQPENVVTAFNEVTPEQLALCRLAEAQTLLDSDMIVSKRGGARWRRWLTRVADSRAAERCVMAFQHAGCVPPPAPPPPRPGPLRLLYAALLPQPRHAALVPGDYDLAGMFAHLTETGPIRIDVFNSVHEGPGQDPRFAAYQERWSAGPVRYFRRLSAAELRRRMPDYDFGWMFSEPSEITVPDKAVCLSARFVGFIAGGLPVVIDDSFELMAGLVRDFQAGVVVPQGDLEALRAAMTATDMALLHAGVRRLWRHMGACNADALARIGRLLSADDMAGTVGA
ncbi:hypothetical protein D3877_28035 [Azospirillum cavernae]|uniref:Glycosyltransferase family 1 protein n=2 Tax=Azospirillum cavernae TaxID=2320860 RepID=A0A418VKS2_9PROT|nr:hypothetical protein D3877_28035 [Azospirillum cavernae]